MNPERDFVWQNMSAIYDGNMSVSENYISESKFRVTPAVPSMLEIKSHFMLSNYVFIHVSCDILTMTLWTCGRRFVFLAPGTSKMGSHEQKPTGRQVKPTELGGWKQRHVLMKYDHSPACAGGHPIARLPVEPPLRVSDVHVGQVTPSGTESPRPVIGVAASGIPSSQKALL